jgi:hypothetical protein
MGQFMAKGVKPLLYNTGFGSLGSKETNWRGLFLLFNEEAEKKARLQINHIPNM